MNIINNIRRSWLYYLLVATIFIIGMSRNFTIPMVPRLSWWNLCWIALPFALAVFAANNNWFILRPVRWIAWPAQRAYIEKKFNETGNAMVYLAILWLEAKGEKAFIQGGLGAINDGMFSKTGDDNVPNLAGNIADAIIKQDKERKASTAAGIITNECGCKTGCGCEGAVGGPHRGRQIDPEGVQRIQSQSRTRA